MMGLPQGASARMPLGGVNLELRVIDGPQEAAGRAALVFLHEGLGLCLAVALAGAS